MKLAVIKSSSHPWYAGGLNFTCTECGNCCTGAPGVVWISDEEIGRLAEFLHLSVQETIEKYCRRLDGRYSLYENRNARGEYDCVFLCEQAVEPAPASDLPNAAAVVETRRTCAIYSVRPLQCRTWPFWNGNLSSKEIWDRSSGRCPGINNGEHFSFTRIEAIRTASDWPRKVPTSADGVKLKPKRNRRKK